MTRLATARPQKYGAKRCSECMVPAHTGCRNCGQHQSIREHHRYQELLLLEKAGAIRNLRQQVRIPLCPCGKRVYVADFVYEENCAVGFGGSLMCDIVYEDAKGYETPLFRLKRHLLEDQGIELRLS